MKVFVCIAFIFFPSLLRAQMLVNTVAGNLGASGLGDGGPATSAGLSETEGIWLDGKCDLYISTFNRVRKVTASTGIITTIAGTGTLGYSGDGGVATSAQIRSYGLFADASDNVYIADAGNNRIRKVDAATGIINTVAGGGTMGDGGQATNASLNDPVNVYLDSLGNIYIAEIGRIRKVNSATGIISTIAGTGTFGLSGDGGLATNAQLSAAGMLFDATGNLYFADRGNNRIRKINAITGIITTVAGTTDGYSGDGGPATAAQLSGPISFVIDIYGNLVIGDNQNDVLRKVDAVTGIITTIAGMGPSGAGSTLEGAPVLSAYIHPEFMYLDRDGSIYYSCFCPQVRKIINYNPGLIMEANHCGETAVPVVQIASRKVELFPNPANDLLHIKMAQGAYKTFSIVNSIGQLMMQCYLTQAETNVAVNGFPPGIYYVTFKGENGVSVQRFVKTSSY